MIDAIERIGQLDNTLVIYIQGDNGASAEGALQGTTNEIGTFVNGVPEDFTYLLSMMDELGGPTTYNHYPVGWAHAMDTPFQWTKQVASHFGGTRNGMVISWPSAIKDKGGIRPQFHHVIDIAPTILEAVGVHGARSCQRRDAEADRRREHGLHVRRCQGAGPAHVPSISRCSATAPSTTTAGWPAPRRFGCRGSRSASIDPSTTSSGSCTT